jgi:hypothetical protein
MGLIGVEVARLTLFEHYLLARQNALVLYDVLTWSLFQGTAPRTRRRPGFV